jgi:hypothetical protein
MIADAVEVTRNDSILGEITAHGRLVDSESQLLAKFTQTVRIARGLSAAIVDVQLEPAAPPEDDPWTSYFASRLAWIDEAASFRRGAQWMSREVTTQRIESAEWVEVSNGAGNIVCFPMGLPFHRLVGPTWLDTLLCVAGESDRRYQFAIGIDCSYPTQTALGLVTAASEGTDWLPYKLTQQRGWFLHLAARNVMLTHLDFVDDASQAIRCRILETEGRGVETTLAAFRPFREARITDFRGNASEVLSTVDGVVHLEIGPHRWIQLEAQW